MPEFLQTSATWDGGIVLCACRSTHSIVSAPPVCTVQEPVLEPGEKFVHLTAMLPGSRPTSRDAPRNAASEGKYYVDPSSGFPRDRAALYLRVLPGSDTLSGDARLTSSAGQSRAQNKCD